MRKQRAVAAFRRLVTCKTRATVAAGMLVTTDQSPLVSESRDCTWQARYAVTGKLRTRPVLSAVMDWLMENGTLSLTCMAAKMRAAMFVSPFALG